MQIPITEITGYPYPDKISYFRRNCRNYKSNQYWLKNIERSLQEQQCRDDQIYDYSCCTFRNIQDVMKHYTILKENLKTVDETMENIRIFYGEEAEEMVREGYLSCKSRKEIAEKYNITENTLQKKYRSWLETVIYQEGRDRA